LVASNILGQNTPAIATTEAHYAEMWAQDAAAMYGYAGSSAAASTLTPFLEPPATTTVSQAAGTGTSAPLSQLVTSVPAALQGLASPATSTSAGSGLQGLLDMLTGNSTSTTGLSGLFNDLFSSSGLGLNANIWNTIFSSGFYMPSNTLGAFTSLFGGAAAAGDAAGAAGDAAGAAGGIGGAVAAPAAGLSELGGLGGGVSAALGRGTAIGALAVPPNWTALAPTVSPLPGLSGAALGGMPPKPPPAVAAGIPGMPFANAAGNRFGAATPRYGFRPIVVVHPPAAG
jgi:PPE-repeat protein